jgi:hypothetical protein
MKMGQSSNSNTSLTVYANDGRSVSAQVLRDPLGSVVSDHNGGAMAAPMDYNPVEKAKAVASSNLGLLAYYPNASFDMQRNYNGLSGVGNNGFVRAFSAVASWDLGFSGASTGWSLDSILMGGGAVNYAQKIGNSKVNVSGPYGNNPNNAINITSGFQAFMSANPYPVYNNLGDVVGGTGYTGPNTGYNTPAERGPGPGGGANTAFSGKVNLGGSSIGGTGAPKVGYIGGDYANYGNGGYNPPKATISASKPNGAPPVGYVGGDYANYSGGYNPPKTTSSMTAKPAATSTSSSASNNYGNYGSYGASAGYNSPANSTSGKSTTSPGAKPASTATKATPASSSSSSNNYGNYGSYGASAGYNGSSSSSTKSSSSTASTKGSSTSSGSKATSTPASSKTTSSSSSSSSNNYGSYGSYGASAGYNGSSSSSSSKSSSSSSSSSKSTSSSSPSKSSSSSSSSSSKPSSSSSSYSNSSVGKAKPIGIDLDGNGVKVVELGISTSAFDFNKDGVREKTAWIGRGDGLLAMDLDRSGTVNATRELAFAGESMASDTDLEAFRANYDTDDNGVFDASDARWSYAGVWQDANQDGISQLGEFKSLTAMGIRSISLISDEKARVLADGTDLKQAMARRGTPKTQAYLKSGLTNYMRGLQKRPAKVKAFLQAPSVRYAA